MLIDRLLMADRARSVLVSKGVSVNVNDARVITMRSEETQDSLTYYSRNWSILHCQLHISQSVRG